MISFLKDLYRQIFLNKSFSNSLLSINYKDYWKTRKNNNFELNDFQFYRLLWLKDNLISNSKIVDLGCGNGNLLINLSRNYNISKKNLLGIDIEGSVLNDLSANGIKSLVLDFRFFDNYKKIPIAEHYILFEVIEHLVEPELLIANLLKKCKKSIFISIPNTGYLPYRLRLLFGKFPIQWRVFPNEHLRFWTYYDFKNWLLVNKFRFEITGYKGLNVFNKILPNIFAAGILVKIDV